MTDVNLPLYSKAVKIMAYPYLSLGQYLVPQFDLTLLLSVTASI